ncbi:hypothetical protein INQ25_01615 [Wolbachia endosymbiont of Rhagoletis cerasi]|nr:hypothetical protein [Wolbachia endosymbiont of Rhagoletis cerasi]MBS9530105.1 hypothetical protein [Wolbachia endosymbiont of Rhagoletis cerasi]
MAKQQPSSRCLLAAEIPRRYDVGLLSFQRVTLESRKKKMDPSVWALE